jgi:hypothetical protein
MRRTAEIDGLYRYTLDRIWRDDLPRVLFVMLNPSTADASKDDPTIRKCIGFSLRWGFGGVRVVNLFAYRETSPAKMLRQWKSGVDVIGPRNFDVLIENVDSHELVIAAWGANGKEFPRESLEAIFSDKLPKCLGTSSGNPYHPLYRPYTTELIDYKIEEDV